MDKKLVKSVGEHWACSELARRGWATALTRDGLARTDILAVNTELPGRPMIEVQVKSATQPKVGARVSWMTGKAVRSLTRFPGHLICSVAAAGEESTSCPLPILRSSAVGR